MQTFESFAAIADRHLPHRAAERWKRLLRPAIGLSEAGSGGPVVGSIGGEAVLPPDMPWPTWQRRGPLTLIAAFDCARLPRIDLELPRSGLIQFFCFDGQVDNRRPGDVNEPSTSGGAQVVVVPEGVRAERRGHPDGLAAYDPIQVAAWLTCSAPDEQSPSLELAFGDDEEVVEALEDDEFVEALAPWDKPDHQLGGHPAEIQSSPEYRGADGRDDTTTPFTRAAFDWRLLLQVGEVEESGMLWGEDGQLYWLATEAGIASGEYSDVDFTWQCG